ncbi:5'/3'-nucleotidase SurE [Candidatus Viridilinea mediisalina]|uniref:5'-nucleotidase SurE n=1 Tax=Candidatus Viridilinea mediisalina TaxID=2024553 RepID=A0A2A6RDR1_9CHLR|nr:5'/3'-nucleotidase SurE [Candidatus Viridilinea mediisalina]PDV99954.1 5'/3'-nucleotidase SurE [Candidatus Viridilinea mediisalina]
MRILVVNDDGINSAGIWELAAGLRAAGLGEPYIVAPETEQSGTSMAVPIQQELFLRPVAAPDPAYAGIRAYAINGTPAGCVIAGVLAKLGPRPDVVIAGINRGINTGTNVMLSGTVGAAMMAALWGLPTMAVSQMYIGDAPMPWQTATWATVRLFPLLKLLDKREPIVLNVNVPHLHDPNEVQGMLATKLSSFFYGAVIDVELDAPQHDASGRQPMEFRFVRERIPTFPLDSDDGAVRAGYISITPLRPSGIASLDLRAALSDL